MLFALMDKAYEQQRGARIAVEKRYDTQLLLTILPRTGIFNENISMLTREY